MRHSHATAVIHVLSKNTLSCFMSYGRHKASPMYVQEMVTWVTLFGEFQVSFLDVGFGARTRKSQSSVVIHDGAETWLVTSSHRWLVANKLMPFSQNSLKEKNSLCPGPKNVVEV
jgi:hypothetical protein